MTAHPNLNVTYTVIDPASGEPLGRHLTVAEAAATILTDDGHEFEIRASDTGHDLWCRQQVTNKGWTRTVVFSLSDDRAEAEAEIFGKVIKSRWPLHPAAISDDDYDKMHNL